jgi:hypothetical protein
MIEDEDLYVLLPGAKALVTACEAAEHGDNAGCLCGLKGRIVTIGSRYESMFAGTPTWWISSDRRARLSELTLIDPRVAANPESNT